jgi:hypothetical protein
MLRDAVLPTAPAIVTRIAHACRQIVILSDDAEKCVAYAGKYCVSRELSDTIRLFAIMAGEFYREISHSGRNVGGADKNMVNLFATRNPVTPP